MSTATTQPPKTPTSGSGKMSRIVVLDDLAAEGLAKLDAAPGIEYDIKIATEGD